MPSFINIPEESESYNSLESSINYRLNKVAENIKAWEYPCALETLHQGTISSTQENLAVRVSKQYVYNQRLLKDKKVRETCNQLAYSSQQETYANGDLCVKIPSISDPQFTAPRILWHDVCLIGMEEYIHVLQTVKNRLIATPASASLRSLNMDELKEIDVVYTLIRMGIPIDEYFLRRRGRRDFIFNFLEKGMKLVYGPIIEKGALVRVKRSSGNIEDAWEVHEVYENKGYATVYDPTHTYKIDYPIEELNDLKATP